jgi:hypothetical protein
VALALPIAVGFCLALLLGGRPSRLADLALRAPWLFLAALGLQVVAFPFDVLPWRTGQGAATALWLASYAVLVVAGALNLRVTGVPLVAAGMTANIAAIAANGGTMPVLPEAMRAAGRTAVHKANSTGVSAPRLSWLVDRWAAPDWLPLANVYSVGDVLIALGAIVVVLAAMGVARPRLRHAPLGAER